MSSRVISQRSASTWATRNWAHSRPSICSRNDGGNGPVPPRALEASGTRLIDLHPAGHHQVVVAGHHPGRGEVHGLLGRTALPVDRGGRHVLGESGRHPGVAGDVGALLAHLAHAPTDDVVDRSPGRRRCARPGGEGEGRAGRPGASWPAPLPACRRSCAARRRSPLRVGHRRAPLPSVVRRSPVGPAPVGAPSRGATASAAGPPRPSHRHRAARPSPPAARSPQHGPLAPGRQHLSPPRPGAWSAGPSKATRPCSRTTAALGQVEHPVHLLLDHQAGPCPARLISRRPS